MKLQLIREHYKPDSTVGRLLVDGTFECFTLEDGVRRNKIHGQTAIPPGSYHVTVEPSPHFGRDLPRLHDVPDFAGVLIHTGNKPADTEGCILVGATWAKGDEVIGSSRIAFAPLFAKITGAIARGEPVEIEVVQESAPADLIARSVAPMRPASGGKKRVAAKQIARKKAGRGKPAAKQEPAATKKRAAKKKRAGKPASRASGRARTRRGAVRKRS